MAEASFPDLKLRGRSKCAQDVVPFPPTGSVVGEKTPSFGLLGLAGDGAPRRRVSCLPHVRATCPREPGPRVLAHADREMVSFWAVLRETADLTPALRMDDWTVRGEFVEAELRRV